MVQPIVQSYGRNQAIPNKACPKILILFSDPILFNALTHRVFVVETPLGRTSY